MTSSRTGRGLTIVEVLIAISLIAIVFAALAAVQVSSLRMTRTSQQGSQATQIAVDRMNVLTTEILAAYASYQACPGAIALDPPCNGTLSDDGFDVAHTIARGSGYTASGLIQLTVNVTGPAEASLSSFVSCMDSTENVVLDKDTVSTDDDEIVSRTPTIRDPWLCEP